MPPPLEKEAEPVGKQMIRPAFSVKRLSFDEKQAKVCYRRRRKTKFFFNRRVHSLWVARQINDNFN